MVVLMAYRVTMLSLHNAIGLSHTAPGYGEVFGPRSRALLNEALTNKHARKLSDDDFIKAAQRLGVPVMHVKGVSKVEAPRGAFDPDGRPTILYERHKFRNNCIPVGRFNASYPDLSGVAYGPGGYGKFSAQYDKLFAACALDPHAAFAACSWGMFQVMGENAVSLDYASPLDMALSLVADEAAHLETFVRYVEVNHLVDELRACRPNDPTSCEPFAAGYNGPGFKAFNYHRQIAAAIA